MKSTGSRRTLALALAALLVMGVVAPGPVAAGEGALRAATDGPGWEWGPSVLWYVLREERDYLQPTLTVDRGPLHLEGRYNYEARDTGSAWVGWNFTFGEDLRLGLTPMLGGVFGQMKGIAPGLTLTLEWGVLTFWSQSEYVFDLGDRSQSYFYVWSEFSVTGPEWLRVGVVLQRTRAFQTSTEVQGGPLIGFSFWRLSATAYLFAPGRQDQFLVLAVAGAF
ncbi:MAG: hypothetical protein WB493_13530 [Anaeromyxobacteraceae bacterium]